MAMDCVICANPFNEGARKPLVGSCGHSLCSTCSLSLCNMRCPVCMQNFSFINKTINFQLIEQILETKRLEIHHNATVKENESAKKELRKLIMESEHAKDRLDILRLNEQRMNQNRSKCPECGSLVDKDHLRLCPGCSESQGIVTLEGDSVKILYVNQADKVVFCSHCALEGMHQGHATVLYTKMKFKQQAEKILSDCEAVRTSRCDGQFSNLKAARENLISALKMVLSDERTASGAELEQVLSDCKDVKQNYEAAMTTLEGQIDTTAETIEGLAFWLKEEAPAVPRTATTAHGTTSGTRPPLSSRQKRSAGRQMRGPPIPIPEESPEEPPLATSTPKRRRQ